MLTCLLKRFVPFLLTMTVGLLIGGLFRQASGPEPSARFDRFEHDDYHHHHCGNSRYDWQPQDYQQNSPVVIRYKPQALYTAEARRDQINGTVELKMLLRKDGTVSDITPVSALPDGLTDEAIKAASRIEFTPAYIFGQPTDTIQLVQYRFDMDGRTSTDF